MSTPDTEKGNARALEPAREDLLDSPAEGIVFLKSILAWLIER
jgi:hypothetical protein